MSYTAPADSGNDSYSMTIKHNSSGIILEVKIVAYDGTTPSRATKDAVFQGAVDKLAGIAGTTILGAKRDISYVSDITPTP